MFDKETKYDPYSGKKYLFANTNLFPAYDAIFIIVTISNDPIFWVSTAPKAV